MIARITLLVCLLAIGTLPGQSLDRALHWSFLAPKTEQGFAAQSETPALPGRKGRLRFGPEDRGGGLVFNASDDVFVLAAANDVDPSLLPREAWSASAWVAIDQPSRWGGIWGCIQDNGGAEKGLLLGYVEDRFAVALATEGKDDGDGHMTYVQGDRPFVLGRWHHVAATYDGQVTKLFVDGLLQAEDRTQTGPLLLDRSAPFVLGGYRDRDEDYPLDGRLLSVRLEARAWTEDEVQRDFRRKADLTKLPAWIDTRAGFVVEPFLTWPAETAISINFEADRACVARVQFRHESAPEVEWREQSSSGAAAIHNFRLEGLEPSAKYFYRVILELGAEAAVTSPVLSFRTATRPGEAFTFVVVGDTQTHGQVAKRVSDHAYMTRPNLVLHAGDLVDNGRRKRDWTETFFPSMQPLIGRVPLMPVLGNHEQDAKFYYDYMSLPEPERWYSFTYGDAEFFMIDGNRALAEQSEQLRWLDSALAASKAKWRFAVLHQPPYTSDSDDYGDTTKTSSRRGDPKVQPIIALFERYGLDICFSGHVHDYERTFPIAKDRVLPYEQGGVIYVTSAGGGGSLEDFDPANTWFGHRKARYHHFVYVALHGDQLEFQAIDEQGRLFDSLMLRKRAAAAPR